MIARQPMQVYVKYASQEVRWKVIPLVISNICTSLVLLSYLKNIY